MEAADGLAVVRVVLRIQVDEPTFSVSRSVPGVDPSLTPDVLKGYNAIAPKISTGRPDTEHCWTARLSARAMSKR
jgi:hypothetical protein